MILIEEEKPIVQLIFHKYLNEGKGTHIIARELKEAGIKPLDPDGTSKYKNDWSKAAAFRNAECSMSEWASDRSLKNIVLYILNTLISDTKGIKEEIIQELSGMSWVEKEVSVEDIEQKLNHLNKKSSKLLDLRLEEEISKDEFKEKKAKIDSEIAELTSNLNAIKDADKDMQMKVDKMAKMIDSVDELLSLKGENVDGILAAVTETITVYENHTVVVKLKDIPLRFRVEYKSTGRLSTYRTEILSLELV